MRNLARNTFFKTAVLTGLFFCVLAAVTGTFPDIYQGTNGGIKTTAGEATDNKNLFPVAGYDVHAADLETLGFEDLPGADIKPVITAGEVGTSKDRLKEFVEGAVDAYYIDFFIREHCDFWEPVRLEHRELVAGLLEGYGINDLSPESIEKLSTEDIKELIPILTANLVAVDPSATPWDACDIDSISLFHDALREEDGPWRSGSIYLFIIDDQRIRHLHGIDKNLEGTELVALDRGGRDVAQLIIDEVRNPPDDDGLVDYCWDDPDVEGDNEDDPDSTTAPGFSWKTSYVVDPFEELGLLPIPGYQDVIFGSGIYPKEGGPLPSGCEIVKDDGDGESENGDPQVLKGTDGGACAIAGSGSIPQSTTFNLLLVVSLLLFSISLGNSSICKQNGV